MSPKSVQQMVFLSSLALAIFGGGLAPAQRVCCQGDIWLKWTHQERKAYILGFATAYAKGYESACRKMDKLWTAPPGTGPEEALLKRCLADEIGLSKSADYYAETVTEFYTRYPGDRDINIDEVIEQVVKGLTIEQIHHHPFWRHSPPDPSR